MTPRVHGSSTPLPTCFTPCISSIWFLLNSTLLQAQTVESVCNEGDPSLIPGLGRSPGEGKGNPFQYSCLDNPMDGGACQATVHGVARSQIRPSDLAFKFSNITGFLSSVSHSSKSIKLKEGSVATSNL